MPLTPHPVAVVDVETTGVLLDDRIIEIGIVTFDTAGREVQRYESLVQPNRDVSNSDVHGITPTMLANAPTFADIARDVASVLDAHILVAHNASFDIRMLRAEFARMNIHWDDPAAVFDTMRWSRKMLPGSPGKLSAALATCGIENAQAHRALGDAEATGKLFYFLLKRGAPLDAHPAHLPAELIGHLPTSAALPRPVETGQRETDAYQQVLIKALDDHVITPDEREQLIRTAGELGLSAEEAAEVHRSMLGRMAVMAWADGVLTKEEAQLIRAAAASLGVDEAELEAILAEPEDVPGIRLTPGGRIVFTGELELPRAVWEEKVISLGYTVGGVTKKTCAVVAADPHSRSGKAKKARQYGVPIISESQLTWLIRHPAEAPADAPLAEPYAAEDQSAAFTETFPWLQGTHTEVASVVDTWIRDYPNEPLAHLSPRLHPDSVPESLDRARPAMQRWLSRHPHPLRSSVADLRALPGIGPKSLSDMLQALALAAMDAEAEAIDPQPLLEWWALSAHDLSPSLADAPAEIHELATRIDDTAPTTRLSLARQAAAQVAQLLSADERLAYILVHRVLAAAPETLEAVGAHFRVTRERIRQLEKQLRTDLREALALHVAVVGQRVPRSIDRARLLEAEADLAVEVTPGLPLIDVVVALSDTVTREGSWIEPAHAREELLAQAAELADEHGTIAWENLAGCGPADEAERRRWVGDAAEEWAVRDDVVFTRTSNSADRAVAVLALRGEPLSAAELVDYIGHGSPRSMDGALSRDERVHRTGRSRWALVSWGGEEFTNVSEWIGRRVDAEGSYPLKDLIAEATDLGIAETTVRVYASTGEYVVDDGQVRRGTEEVLAEADPEEYAGMFVRDGVWQLLITVKPDHLRGSGFAVPRCLAGMFDVPFLGHRTFSSPEGDQALYFGRTNVTTGTIRRFLEAIGAQEGDRLWLCFSEDGTFSITPATPRVETSGLANILNFCGMDDRVDDLAGLNVALGLAPDAPRRRTVSRFNHRGQEEIAEEIRAM